MHVCMRVHAVCRIYMYVYVCMCVTYAFVFENNRREKQWSDIINNKTVAYMKQKHKNICCLVCMCVCMHAFTHHTTSNHKHVRNGIEIKAQQVQRGCVQRFSEPK